MADLEPAYLLLGNDRQKVATALRRMKARFGPEAIEVHSALSITGEAAVNACLVMGLFSTERLVIVHGADAWKAEDVDAVIGYLKAPAEDAVLLLTADKLAANSRLKKAFAKPRLVECKGPEKEGEVVSWVVKVFADNGAQVNTKVASRLVAICGFDSLDRLATDVERIVVYAGEDPITVELIEQLATEHSEEKVWALTDAWASRDRSAFLNMTEQLLAQREHPVRLVGVIGRHLRTVHQARRLLGHLSPGQVQQELVQSGTNAWAARKVVEQAQRINLPMADAALARIALLDSELKGGSALASGKVSGDRDSMTIVFERGLCEL